MTKNKKEKITAEFCKDFYKTFLDEFEKFEIEEYKPFGNLTSKDTRIAERLHNLIGVAVVGLMDTEEGVDVGSIILALARSLAVVATNQVPAPHKHIVLEHFVLYYSMCMRQLEDGQEKKREPGTYGGSKEYTH